MGVPCQCAASDMRAPGCAAERVTETLGGAALCGACHCNTKVQTEWTCAGICPRSMPTSCHLYTPSGLAQASAHAACPLAANFFRRGDAIGSRGKIYNKSPLLLLLKPSFTVSELGFVWSAL